MASIDPNNLAGTATMTFDDEFNSLSLWNGTSGTWDTAFQFTSDTANGGTLSSNGEQEWYINSNYAPTASVKPWSVSNGVLDIAAAPASSAISSLINGYQYTSGQINTSKSFSQTYGYFEMKAELPSGQGLWPAFWLMPQNGSWPPELDAMEMLGNDPTKIYTTVHYDSTNQSMSQGETVANTSTGFHTYGVDWEPDYITWYFDGQQVYKVATPSDMTGANASPMYMLANLAVGGGWPGNANSTTPFPATMQIDYIRAYQSVAAAGGSSSGSTSGSGATGSTSGSSTSGSSTSGSSTSGSGSSSSTGAGSSTTSTSSGSTSTTIGSTGATTAQTLTAPNDNGTTILGGSGNDTLVASHGADVLTGGAGADTFRFGVIPWAAGQVTDFRPGVDKLDLSALFLAAGYHGKYPGADGYLNLTSDGHGGTDVWFNPTGNASAGHDLITDLTGVAPTSLNVARDINFGQSSSTTTTSTSGSSASTGPTTIGSATGTASQTLTATSAGGTHLVGGLGNDVLIASTGPDTLTGGAGKDTFAFRAIPTGAGHVTDFTPGVDKLDLSALFLAAGYHGKYPGADGYLNLTSDGHGGTDVWFNPTGNASAGHDLITDLDGVAPTSVNVARDINFGQSGSTISTSTGSSSTTTSSAGLTLSDPGNFGMSLTGGPGADTLIASHAADVMTGGGGADTFSFNVVPWSAGHVTDFTPGTDHLNVHGLLTAYHYSGANPITDGWISLANDGKGDTQVFFNAHDGSNNGNPYLVTTLDHVTASSLHATDWIF